MRDVTPSREELATVNPDAFAPYAFGGGGRVDDWLALNDAGAAGR